MLGFVMSVFIILALLYFIPWSDVLYDPEIDGEKRPAPDEAEIKDFNNSKIKKIEDKEFIDEDGYKTKIEMDIRNKTARTVTMDENGNAFKIGWTGIDETENVTFELTPDEENYFEKYRQTTAKKRKVLLNLEDLQRVKPYYLLGLSAREAADKVEGISESHMKSYFAILNAVNNPKYDKKIPIPHNCRTTVAQ